MAIVVRGANSTHLYPLGGTYGGHVGYRFGTRWYMVAVEQRHRRTAGCGAACAGRPPTCAHDHRLHNAAFPLDRRRLDPADLRNLITFQGADAWRWDALRQGYVMLIRHGRVTMDGREWLALRPAYCT